MYEAEVLRGAKMLDGIKPGWEKEINLDTLNLYLKDSCMIGQLFGQEAANKLESTKQDAISNGFWLRDIQETGDVYHDIMSIFRNYRLLTVAWESEILRRRSIKTMLQRICDRIKSLRFALP